MELVCEDWRRRGNEAWNFGWRLFLELFQWNFNLLATLTFWLRLEGWKLMLNLKIFTRILRALRRLQKWIQQKSVYRFLQTTHFAGYQNWLLVCLSNWNPELFNLLACDEMTKWIKGFVFMAFMATECFQAYACFKDIEHLAWRFPYFCNFLGFRVRLAVYAMVIGACRIFKWTRVGLRKLSTG